jgi:hypothetical protein
MSLRPMRGRRSGESRKRCVHRCCGSGRGSGREKQRERERGREGERGGPEVSAEGHTQRPPSHTDPKLHKLNLKPKIHSPKPWT